MELLKRLRKKLNKLMLIWRIRFRNHINLIMEQLFHLLVWAHWEIKMSLTLQPSLWKPVTSTLIQLKYMRTRAKSDKLFKRASNKVKREKMFTSPPNFYLRDQMTLLLHAKNLWLNFKLIKLI